MARRAAAWPWCRARPGGSSLKFVRQLLRRSEQGKAASSPSAAELQKLKEEHAPGRLTVLPLDQWRI
ncbi:unnamed protein product [Urochloa humidicola]